MSLFKNFITKSVFAAAQARPQGQEAVAVFFYGTAPTPEQIAALARNAEVSSRTEGSKTRISVSWPDVSTTITIDAAWDKTQQMTGMRGWVERFPERVRVLTDVAALINSFDNVSACYGTVTTPTLDADNKVVTLLKAMQGEGGGFFFSRNSFYGTDGLRITGFEEDPVWLGLPPAGLAT